MKAFTLLAMPMLLVACLIVFDNEMMRIDGQCESVLYGDHCDQDQCNKDCREYYTNPEAYGICFFFKVPNDTCLCRHPC